MNVTFRLKGKRVILSSDDKDLFDQIRLNFSIKNPNKRHSRFASDRVYAITPLGSFKPGLFFDILRHIISIDSNIKFNVEEDVMSKCRPLSINVDDQELLDVEADGYEDRDYQEEAIRQILKYGRGIVKLATSAGKSYVIYKSLINIWKFHKKGTVLILVPTVQLVHQMNGDCIDYGCPENEISMFTADHPFIKEGANIIVANRQWLERHKEELPHIDYLYADEVHTLGKGTVVGKFVENLPTNIKIGLTGTMPDKPHQKEKYWSIQGLTGQILITRQAKDLQKDGFVANLHIKLIKMDHKEPQPECRDPELDAIERAKRRFPLEWKFIEESEWFNEYVTNLAMSRDGNTFVLFDHTNHGRELERLCKLKNKTGKDIFYVDGSVKVSERNEMCKIMDQKGDCVLIGNTKCVGTGVSIKALYHIIFAFTSGNANVKIIQSIGRGLRMRHDKDTVILYDIFHEFKYSMKHMRERLKMYKDEYIVSSWETIIEDKIRML